MKVFLSSTYRDLIEHRKAVINALERLGQQADSMEIFGAQPTTPITASLSAVEVSDLFIGIYAHRYGVIPDGLDISITEMELNHAIKLNKQIFAFIVDEDHPWPPKMIEGEPRRHQKLVALKNRVSKGFVQDTFTTPDNAAFKISTSIGRYLFHKTKPSSTKNPYLDLLQTSGDLTDLLEATLRLFEDLTMTDYNQIFLTAESAYARYLIAVADAIPSHKQRYRFAILAGLLGSVLTSSRTLNAQNVRERPGYFQAVVETMSELVVPIPSENTIVGVFNSESEEVNHYDDEIVRKTELLAQALGELLPRYRWAPSLEVDEMPCVSREPKTGHI